MNVSFTEPQIVTNAACCSDPRTMCPTCAAAALAARGVVGNGSPGDLELLVIPAMNWERPDKPPSPSERRNATDRRPPVRSEFLDLERSDPTDNLTTNADGAELLGLPRMKW